jgi:hypothetical protein
MKKHIPFAIVYDFDGTLAPGNMQEREFIPKIGMKTKKFWNKVSEETKKHQADNILIYMNLMLVKANSSALEVREIDIQKYGKDLDFFAGVLPYEIKGVKEKGWFDRINKYGKESNINIEHYIVSSGIREMIQGTKISNKFKAIYASSFIYDHHGIAKWPGLAINYTTKTQFLFRINKGCLDVSDSKIINKYIPDEDRPIPFKNMIYIGDGDTDIPCFRLIKDRGGNSIAVYKPNTAGAKSKSKKFMDEGRVNFTASADYRNNKLLDRIVKGVIDKIQNEEYIKGLK